MKKEKGNTKAKERKKTTKENRIEVYPARDDSTQDKLLKKFPASDPKTLMGF